MRFRLVKIWKTKTMFIGISSPKRWYVNRNMDQGHGFSLKAAISSGRATCTVLKTALITKLKPKAQVMKM